MNKKKIIWIIILITIILIIISVFFISLNKKNLNTAEKLNNNINIVNKEKSTSNKKDINNKNTIKTKLNDGMLYYLQKEPITSDVIIGNNYFDTQINDMMYNPKNYIGKKIEIEGMFLDDTPYTFVGRYATTSLCAYCSPGYSYMEYNWDGEKIILIDKDSWIKVIGTLEKGNDETLYNQEYYYINAISIEVMDKRGQDTIKN